MGIFSSIFSSKEAVSTAVKGVYEGVDKVWYTNEEKAEGFLKLLKAYEPFKLAQRLIGLTVVGTYIGVWILSAVLFIIGAVIPPEVITNEVDKAVTTFNYGQHLVNSSKELAVLNNDTLGLPTAIILGFYFGGGAVEGIATKINEKRGKSVANSG